MDNIVATFAGAYRSKRLIYRDIENNDADREVMHSFGPANHVNWGLLHGLLFQDVSKQANMEVLTKMLASDLLMKVFICLPNPEHGETSELDELGLGAKGAKERESATPIGSLTLDAISTKSLNAPFTCLGLVLDEKYQNQGYGGEAINWATDWAFKYANVHKVQINAIELLLRIIGYLGPEFFQQDIARLAISKYWYDVSWQVLMWELCLTTKSVHKFASSESLLIGCQYHVNTLNISIGGLGHSRPLVHDHNGAKVPDRTTSTALHIADGTAGRVNASLAILAATFQESHSLRYLKLKARRQGRWGYLMAESLIDLLSVGQLTSLEFDTPCSWPTGCHPIDSQLHICRVINSLLPSLRRLRCRMDSVCGCLLEVPPPLQASPSQVSRLTTLKLDEVIINLSIYNHFETIPTYIHSAHCTPYPNNTAIRLKDIVEGQAVNLLSHCDKAPSMIRVISHDPTSLEISAFVAVTGRRLRLKTHDQWDGDGEDF
ncbi:hypothetical protein BX600DRAFT_514986 [Xylariales sp. PMI_506]|nr:hypothetical protein BX600DRAFT_514986 [Xylariales sp. PMI_506]